MRQLVAFLLLALCLTSVAQTTDTINVTLPDTNIIHLEDTIFGEELIERANVEQLQEELLMQLLEEQGRDLARQDSIAQAQVLAKEQVRLDSLAQLVEDSIRRAEKYTWPYDSAFYALSDSLQQIKRDSIELAKRLSRQEIVYDSAYIARHQAISSKAHPLLKELVFMPIPLKMDWDLTPQVRPYYYGCEPQSLEKPHQTPQYAFWTDTLTQNLHTEARRRISRENADLYGDNFQNLPDADTFLKLSIITNRNNNLNVEVNGKIEQKVEKIEVEEIKLKKWTYGGSALAQFTQHYISDNWYKGGSSNMAILGILTGGLKYDNKDNIVWENQGEWRVGFNTVEGDTIRKINTNDDLFRLYSKLGLKAFKKFYYTASAEFKTQFFNTYKGINSPVLKTAAFSPIQVYLNIGIDYKPFAGLSVMLAPLTYKYVFVSDTLSVSQNSFGIEKGRRSLHDIGSSLRVEYTYKPIEEVSLVNKLYLYTNYTDVEIDWEIVCNFIINRYLSARIMLHPRFDNTVISKGDEKAKIQFREMVSVGFSHKF